MPDEFDPSTPLKNTRHEKVVQNILLGQNQTEAYINAGYEARGNTAETNAARLLRNAQVKKRLAWLKEQSAEKAIITAAEVIQELKNIALSRKSNYLSWGEKDNHIFATLKNSEDLSDEHMAAIQSVKITSGMFGKNIEIKTHSKTRALKMLGDHLGIFKAQESNESGLDVYLEQLERAREKYGSE